MRGPIRAVVLGLLTAAVLTCGSDPPNVGSQCTGIQCDEGLTCNLNVPGGYCTAACNTRGSTSECPEASVCDEALLGTYCLKRCTVQTDCRTDQNCNGISGSELKACHPK